MDSQCNGGGIHVVSFDSISIEMNFNSSSLSHCSMQFAGTSWHELNYIRQAVGFLVCIDPSPLFSFFEVK